MSVSAGLYIQLEGDDLQAISLIRSLLESGWSLNDHGAVNILPLGDDDTFTWTSYSPFAEQEVWTTLERKQAAGEKIGVTLLFGDSGVGGEFLIDSSGLVTFSATVERRQQGMWSDVTWYLERLLPALSRVARISSWEWAEST
jgi:hypothetical protein